MIATIESLQGKLSCELNVNLIKCVSPLVPNDITINWSCLITINVEDIDNVGEFDSAKEDKES